MEMKWAQCSTSEMVEAERESKKDADGPSLLVHHRGQWNQGWTWSRKPASGASSALLENQEVGWVIHSRVWIPRSAAKAAPGNSLEMQVLRPHYHLGHQKLWLRSSAICVNRPPADSDARLEEPLLFQNEAKNSTAQRTKELLK